MFFILPFCIYLFWEKCFLASFLNNLHFSLLTNLFSSSTLFSSCFSPQVCLRLWFFFKKKKFGFSSPFFFSLFQFVFFAFSFFEHRSFLVPFFLLGTSCFWFLLLFFWTFLVAYCISIFQLLEPKKTFVFETSHHFLRCLKKKLMIFENVFDIQLCFTFPSYSILVSLIFFLLVRLKEYLFFLNVFSGDLPFFSVSWLFFFSSFLHSRFFCFFFCESSILITSLFRYKKHLCCVCHSLYFSIFSIILLSSLFCFHLFKSSFCCFFIFPFSFPSGKYFLVLIFFTVLSNLLSFLFSLFFFISFFPVSCFFACSFHFCLFFFFLSFVSPFSLLYFFLVFFSSSPFCLCASFSPYLLFLDLFFLIISLSRFFLTSFVLDLISLDFLLLNLFPSSPYRLKIICLCTFRKLPLSFFHFCFMFVWTFLWFLPLVFISCFLIFFLHRRFCVFSYCLHSFFLSLSLSSFVFYLIFSYFFTSFSSLFDFLPKIFIFHDFMSVFLEPCLYLW